MDLASARFTQVENRPPPDGGNTADSEIVAMAQEEDRSAAIDVAQMGGTQVRSTDKAAAAVVATLTVAATIAQRLWCSSRSNVTAVVAAVPST